MSDAGYQISEGLSVSYFSDFIYQTSDFRLLLQFNHLLLKHAGNKLSRTTIQNKKRGR